MTPRTPIVLEAGSLSTQVTPGKIEQIRTDVPPKWGDDDLSAYLHSAHRNRIATFANKEGRYAQLSKIDQCFSTVVKGWINPPDLISPLLFIRSHSAYRAACDNALAGQVGDLYGQLRACLERAGYALLIGKTPGLADVWLNRHKSDAEKNATKKAFTVASIRKCLEAFDQHGARRFQDFYDLTIDLGAHPNEQAVTGNLKIEEGTDRKQFSQVFMHGEGVHLEHGLVMTARVGLCALETMQNLYGPRFELLGVRAAILDLRRGL